MGSLNASQNASEKSCLGLVIEDPADLLEYSKTSFIILVILNTFVLLTASLGNLLILAAIWRNSSLRSPSITLIFGLALSDLCVGFIAEPLKIGFYVLIYKESGNINSCTLITMSGIASIMLTEVTMLLVTAISIDRYLAIYLHLRYEQVVTDYRTKIVVLFLWIASGLHSIIWIVSESVTMITSAVVITICLVTVLFIWIKFFQLVRHHQAQIQDQLQAQAQQFNMTRFRKSAINNMIILVIFLVCYFPYLIGSILLAYKISYLFLTLGDFASFLVALNSSLNPLVYCWRHHGIRAAAKDTLMKLRCQTTGQ